jgi:hypothetical protein
MRLVGLVGPKRSGKSTAADVLVRERGFVSIGFADALKDLALRVNPTIADTEGLYGGPLVELERGIGWDMAKDCYPEVRRFLQELGTGVRVVNPRFWIDAWTRRWRQLDFPELVVVPDVRFVNEALRIRAMPFADDDASLLIRITRPGLDSSDTHVSETEQAGIQCDREIINNSSEAMLTAAVLGNVDDWASASAA